MLPQHDDDHNVMMWHVESKCLRTPKYRPIYILRSISGESGWRGGGRGATGKNVGRLHTVHVRFNKKEKSVSASVILFILSGRI